MDRSQALTSPPTPVELMLGVITPPEVWTHLTPNQQNDLLQTVVHICREVLLPLALTEAGHE